MKIHCLYNPQYQFLFDNYFKSSLKEDFEIITKIVNLNDYHLISIEKLRFIDEKLKENEQFIFLDVDMQFFGPIQPVFDKFLKHFDITFMNGSSGSKIWANTGMVIANRNEKTVKFIEGALNTLLKNTMEHFHDEEVINYGLVKYRRFVKTGLLGKEFWCGHRLWNGNGMIPNHPLLCHHATGTNLSLDKKIEQLELFKQTFGRPIPPLLRLI